MNAETLHLAAATLSGAWTALAIAERLLLRYKEAPFNSYTSCLPLWTIVVIAPIFLYCYKRHYWLRKQRIYKTRAAHIYPHRDPIYGADWLLDMVKAIKNGTMLDVLHETFTSVGTTFWHLATGSWVLITIEPENLKAILATDFEDWPIGGAKKTGLMMTAGVHSIFALNGKEWQHARALIRPSFTRNQIADFQCQDRHVERLLDRIPRDGTVVELQNLIYLFTMDSATDFMFGYSTRTLIDPTEETLDFAKAFDYMIQTAATRSRLGWMSFFIKDKEFDRSIATCRRFIDRYMDKAIADSKIQERPYIFLNEIIKSGASHQQIRDQLLSMIIGGRDTTAGTMSSLFWILARRPDLYKKAREEIKPLKERKPTWEDLKGLKYVNMILKETLRLYPAVATNMRVAAKDTILPKGGGPDCLSPLFVPKGTQCRWSLYSLHRRKDIFGEDAENFHPERWETLRAPWEYLPFSGGPRICIGQQFALTQMCYLLTRVLQTFESVEPGDDRPMLHAVSASTSLINGCHVKFKAV